MARGTIIKARNNTGTTIYAGSVVYISGHDETIGQPTIALADNRYESRMPAVGVVSYDAEHGEYDIKVRTSGACAGFDTFGRGINTNVYVGRNGGIVYGEDPYDSDVTVISQRLGTVLTQEDYPIGQLQLFPFDVKKRIPHDKLIDVELDQHHEMNHADRHRWGGPDALDYFHMRAWIGAPIGSGSTNHIAYWKNDDTLYYDSNLQWDPDNNILKFGSTSSYPAIKVNGATLEARLAGDDGYSIFMCSYPVFDDHAATKKYVDDIVTSIGAITGSGAVNKVTLWSGANTITYDAELHYDSGTNSLGIGTIPSTKLHVSGSGAEGGAGLFASTDNYNSLKISAGGGATFFQQAPSTGSAAYYDNQGDSFTYFRVNGAGTTAMTIDYLGRVGIGAAPNAIFNPYSTTEAQGRFNGYATQNGANTNAGEINIGYVDSGIGARIQVDGAVTGDLIIENIFDNSAGDIRFRTRTAGTDVEGLTILGDGNVGIGETTPITNLHVSDATSATVRIQGAANPWEACLELQSGSGSGSSYYIKSYGTTGEVRHFALTNYYPTFYANNAERMRIDTSGYVGIGCTPSCQLEINGSGACVVKMHAGAGEDSRLMIGSGGSGNRYSYIDLVSDDTYTNFGLRIIRNNGGVNTTSDFTHRGTGGMRFISEDAGYITLSTTNTERMRIDPSGNIGIGTTAIPHGAIGAAKFAIDGTNASTAGPHIQFTTASDDYPLLQILNYSHDNISINFDSFWDGAWKSSDAGSNFQIYKLNDSLLLQYDSGVTAGNALSWNTWLTLNTAGEATFNGVVTFSGGTSFDGYVNPSLDVTYGLGTPSLRWDSLSLGPDSLHLISTDAETGTGRDWNIGVGTTSATGNLLIHEGNKTIFAIDPSGDVGIGETNPDARLHVNYPGATTPAGPTGTWAARIDMHQDTSAYNGLSVVNRWHGTGSTIFEAGSFYTPGVGETYYPLFTINGVGNVGIGVASPTYPLHVERAVAGTYLSAKFKTNTTNSASDVLIVDQDSSSTRAALQVQGNAGAKEVLFVSSGGPVGIGATAPEARLHVYENTTVGTTLNNVQLLTTIAGTTGNAFYNRTWLRRDAGGADWTTLRLHDAISIDSSFGTPGTDTRCWIERDPSGEDFYFGSTTTTYLYLGSSSLQYRSDIDIYSTFGRAWIGYDGTNADHACFGHYDKRNSADFALKQEATGTTTLNAPAGVSVNFAHSGTPRWYINGSTFDFICDGTYQILADDNSSNHSAPAYSFNGDDDTGIYQVSANVLGFSAGGALNASIGNSQLKLENGYDLVHGAYSHNINITVDIQNYNSTNSGCIRAVELGPGSDSSNAYSEAALGVYNYTTVRGATPVATGNCAVFGAKYNTGADGFAGYFWNNDNGTANNAIYARADGVTGSKYGVQAQVSGGGTNYGFYANSSGGTTNYAFYAQAGISRFNDGVGINVNPSTDLHVYGADDSTYGQLTVQSSGNDARIEFYNSDGATTTGRGAILMSKTSGYEGLRFMINNSDAMIIDENKRVGIGLTAPTYTLDVTGTVQFTDGANYARFYRSSDGAGELRFISWTNGWNINEMAASKNLYLNRDSPSTVSLWLGRNGLETVIRGSDGFVGVNTSSITNTLTVNGGITRTTTSGTYEAGVLGYTDANWGFLHRPPQAGSTAAHGFEAFDGTDLMFLQEAGQLALKETTTPTATSGFGKFYCKTDGKPYFQNDSSVEYDLAANTALAGTGTATRVAFWSAANQFSSSANLYWDDGNSRLGIGTTSPGTYLQIDGSISGRQAHILYPGGTGDGSLADIAIGQSIAASACGLFGFRYDTTAADAGSYIVNYGDSIPTCLFVRKGGNVGIGTITPGYALDVTSRIRVQSNGGTTAGIWFADGTTDRIFCGAKFHSATGTLQEAGFWLNSGWRFYVRGDGDVIVPGILGVGSTSPTEKLEVYPDTDSSAIIGRAFIGKVSDGASDFATFSHVDAHALANYGFLHYAAGETLINTASGQGIRFRVANSTKWYMDGTSFDWVCYGTCQMLADDSSSSNSAPGYSFYGDQDTGMYQISANNLGFSTGGSERMRITSAGDVNIGSTAAYRLYVYDNVSSGFSAYIQNGTGGSTLNYGIGIQCGDAAGSSCVHLTCYDGDGTLHGTLYSSYGVMGLWNASDELLKENINPTQVSGLETISKINLIEFNFKKHGPKGKHRIGFSAQNCETAYPEMVVDSPVDKSGKVHKMVSQDRLIPVLTKAIQEQQDIIEELKARIEALENA